MNLRRLLWVDDDGRERFPYEIFCLSRIGWHITWAESAEEAIRLLLAENFDLVLLDQVFPFETNGRSKDVWSGCRVLYWIRGKGVPPGSPSRGGWSRLVKRRAPLNGNSDVPVIVISAFQDDDVDAALKAIRLPPEILPKPVDENLLLKLVNRVGFEGSNESTRRI